MNKRRTLLLTNDDGYSAGGIRSLHDALAESFDVVVAAPTTEQSGIGHAFTFNRPLSHFPLPHSVGMTGWAVSGTPSDCVKFAVSHLLKDMPDLVVSGMNLGENSGISSYYSGTVAAAREGAFWRIPSFAFSVCKGSEIYLADYSRMAHRILNYLAKEDGADRTKIIFYNVNFPDCRPSLCRGIRATRQSMAYFDDKYRRVSNDASDQEGFIVYGDKVDVEQSDTFDSRAILNRYVAVTPLCFDATAEWAIPALADLEQSLPIQQ
jgi:5'-nucleotidase